MNLEIIEKVIAKMQKLKSEQKAKAKFAIFF